jgi:hypothetical protein
MTGADDGGGMHACVPHVELSCELWCSVVRPGEVRCNYISLFKEKTIIVMGLADLNRLVAAVAQQRRVSPAHRYYATIVAMSHLPLLQ